MAKEISNGTHTVKLYNYVDRGRKMHQLAYYEAGKRKLRNFSIKLSDITALEVQVIENAHRQDLDHLEEGGS